jgi:carbon storage regulator
VLILTRKLGQSITVGDSIKVTVTKISGNEIRLGITAPQELKILRAELRDDPEERKVQDT